MIIAIDWDKTFTVDPGLFSLFINGALDRGHKCIIVTGRQKSDPVVPPFEIPIIYAGNEWKNDAALAAGYKVDIWIDDMPGMIMPCQKLQW